MSEAGCSSAGAATAPRRGPAARGVGGSGGLPPVALDGSGRPADVRAVPPELLLVVDVGALPTPVVRRDRFSLEAGRSRVARCGGHVSSRTGPRRSAGLVAGGQVGGVGVPRGLRVDGGVAVLARGAGRPVGRATGRLVRAGVPRSRGSPFRLGLLLEVHGRSGAVVSGHADLLRSSGGRAGYIRRISM